MLRPVPVGLTSGLFPGFGLFLCGFVAIGSATWSYDRVVALHSHGARRASPC